MISDRVGNIRDTIDVHSRDDDGLYNPPYWRLFCRNSNCKPQKYLNGRVYSPLPETISVNPNDYAKDDGKPVLMGGFAFCEECAKIISVGYCKTYEDGTCLRNDGKFAQTIILEPRDMNLYSSGEIQEMYRILKKASGKN